MLPSVVTVLSRSMQHLPPVHKHVGLPGCRCSSRLLVGFGLPPLCTQPEQSLREGAQH